MILFAKTDDATATTDATNAKADAKTDAQTDTATTLLAKTDDATAKTDATNAERTMQLQKRLTPMQLPKRTTQLRELPNTDAATGAARATGRCKCPSGL